MWGLHDRSCLLYMASQSHPEDGGSNLLCLSFSCSMQKFSCFRAQECPTDNPSHSKPSEQGGYPAGPILLGGCLWAPESFLSAQPSPHTAGRATRAQGNVEDMPFSRLWMAWLGFLGNVTLRASRPKESLQESSSSRSGRQPQAPVRGPPPTLHRLDQQPPIPVARGLG
jgi:hypothetical protein